VNILLFSASCLLFVESPLFSGAPPIYASTPKWNGQKLRVEESWVTYSYTWKGYQMVTEVEGCKKGCTVNLCHPPVDISVQNSMCIFRETEILFKYGGIVGLEKYCLSVGV
jgi:hypothetical protein